MSSLEPTVHMQRFFSFFFLKMFSFCFVCFGLFLLLVFGFCLGFFRFFAGRGERLHCVPHLQVSFPLTRTFVCFTQSNGIQRFVVSVWAYSLTVTGDDTCTEVWGRGCISSLRSRVSLVYGGQPAVDRPVSNWRELWHLLIKSVALSSNEIK